jgi:hypothetical protein
VLIMITAYGDAETKRRTLKLSLVFCPVPRPLGLAMLRHLQRASLPCSASRLGE